MDPRRPGFRVHGMGAGEPMTSRVPQFGRSNSVNELECLDVMRIGYIPTLWK